MKAITIHQPWASLIAEGIKDVENRSWTTIRRARLAIHASKTSDWAAFDDPRVKAVLPEPVMAESRFPHGAVVAVATLADAHWARPECCTSAWGNQASAFDFAHFVLTDVVQLVAPVACRGMQRIWNLPGDVEYAVVAQLQGMEAS